MPKHHNPKPPAVTEFSQLERELHGIQAARRAHTLHDTDTQAPIDQLEPYTTTPENESPIADVNAATATETRTVQALPDTPPPRMHALGQRGAHGQKPPERLTRRHRWTRPLVGYVVPPEYSDRHARTAYTLQVELARLVLDHKSSLTLEAQAGQVDFILPGALGALLLDMAATPKKSTDPRKAPMTKAVRLRVGSLLPATCEDDATAIAGLPLIYPSPVPDAHEFGLEITSPTIASEAVTLRSLLRASGTEKLLLPLIRFVGVRLPDTLSRDLASITSWYIPPETALHFAPPVLIHPPAYETLGLSVLAKYSGQRIRSRPRRVETSLQD